jgi:DNA-binding XRE family transcriptional regulator
MNVKTIARGGIRYVLVPERAFKRMREDLEDLDDIRAYDRAKSKPQEFIPAAFAKRLLDGENPIRVYREYRGMTQEALAAKADISKPFLSQLENERRVMSMRVLRSLAKALKVDFDDLDPVPNPVD